MKTAIFSFTSSQDNYGQLLQCYALEKALEKLGCEAFHVQYLHYLRNGANTQIGQKIKGILRRPDYRYLVDLSRKVRSRFAETPDRGFNKFRENSLNIYPTPYYSIQELKSDPPVADVYIAGSDQIWGMDYENEDTEGWFLGFGPKDVNRISYAASIGRKLSREELPQFKKWISNLNEISVRERGAQDECRTCDIEAQVVLDPTLLLDASDYSDLTGSAQVNNTEPYMFAYILNILFAEDIHWNRFDKYALKSNLNVLPVYSSGYYSAFPIIKGRKPVYPTIPEWISYISKASCVITTSFHGVVFSILFETPFIALPLAKGHGKGNDRIPTLLRSLGLDSRLYNNRMSIEEQMEAPIDWKSVRERLAVLRTSSVKFLSDSLFLGHK